MTLTAPAPQQTAAMATGHIAQIIGPVVDVLFPPDQLPEIYWALEIDLSQIVGTGDGKASGESAAMKGVELGIDHDPASLPGTPVLDDPVVFVVIGLKIRREATAYARADPARRSSTIVGGGRVGKSYPRRCRWRRVASVPPMVTIDDVRELALTLPQLRHAAGASNAARETGRSRGRW